MNKPKLSASRYGISIEFNYQDHVYVVTDHRGQKSFIRNRKSADVAFKRLVEKFEENVKIGLYVV